MDTELKINFITNGKQTITTGVFSENSGVQYKQVLTEYNNGMWTDSLFQQYGTTTITTDKIGNSDGDVEFIETETNGINKRITSGNYDKDKNLSNLVNLYYENGTLRQTNRDENADGNPEYEAFYNIDGGKLSEHFDDDSDGVYEIENFYNEDGTYLTVDKRSFLEKVVDLF